MIKQVIKLILGQSKWNHLVSMIKYVKTQSYFKLGRNSIFQLNEEWEKEEYYVEGKAYFFGYYDIAQMNIEEDKILAHVVKHNAVTSNDRAIVGYFP